MSNTSEWLTYTNTHTHTHTVMWHTELNLTNVKRGLPSGTTGKEPTCQCKRCESQVRSLGWEKHLEKAMAGHCSILAWRIPWTEEPRGLQSKGLQRIQHYWATKHSTQRYKHCIGLWESMDDISWDLSSRSTWDLGSFTCHVLLVLWHPSVQALT